MCTLTLAECAKRGEQREAEWNDLMLRYAEKYPELKKEYDAWFNQELPEGPDGRSRAVGV